MPKVKRSLAGALLLLWYSYYNDPSRLCCGEDILMYCGQNFFPKKLS